MSEKPILEQALLQVQTLEEAVKQNAKGILASTMKQELSDLLKESLEEEENEKYQQLIKKGGALNELNHPSSSLIDLDRVSHSILETWWDGKMLMGKIKLFTSPGWKKMGVVSTKGDQAAMLS